MLDTREVAALVLVCGLWQWGTACLWLAALGHLLLKRYADRPVGVSDVRPSSLDLWFAGDRAAMWQISRTQGAEPPGARALDHALRICMGEETDAPVPKLVSYFVRRAKNDARVTEAAEPATTLVRDVSPSAPSEQP